MSRKDVGADVGSRFEAGYSAWMRASPKPMTADEFLRWEIRQVDKHEFAFGEIRAMAGASRGHQTIALNAAVALRNRLRGGPCRALHEQKILTPAGHWRYADVAVDCGPQAMGDLAASAPRLIVEVESPSNTPLEFLERLEDYQSVASVQEILVLSQTKPKARLYRRAAGGWRHTDFAGLDAEIACAALGLVLPMAELYEDVVFAEA